MRLATDTATRRTGTGLALGKKRSASKEGSCAASLRSVSVARGQAGALRQLARCTAPALSRLNTDTEAVMSFRQGGQRQKETLLRSCLATAQERRAKRMAQIAGPSLRSRLPSAVQHRPRTPIAARSRTGTAHRCCRPCIRAPIIETIGGEPTAATAPVNQVALGDVRDAVSSCGARRRQPAGFAELSGKWWVRQESNLRPAD